MINRAEHKGERVGTAGEGGDEVRSILGAQLLRGHLFNFLPSVGGRE